MKKVAIMGGTFDPIHLGHLIAAQSVYESGHFDDLWIMPTGNPPHKTENLTESSHRLKMCQLAVKGYDHLQVSEFEMQRPGVIYTVETFIYLKEAYPDHSFYLIIGTDAVKDLIKWYRHEELMATANFVIVDRSGYSQVGIDELTSNYYNLYGTEFISVTMPQVELSSTDIRVRVQEGKSIRYRVADSVSQYIDDNGLYL